MVAWNLAVSLSGNGDGLVRELNRAAREAKAVARELAAVRREIAQLAAAGGNLSRLSTGLRSSEAPLRTLRSGASAAGTQVQALARHAQSATSELAGLGRAASAADGQLSGVGRGGARSMGDMDGAVRRLRQQMSGLAGLLAGGGLVMGLHDLVEAGNEYQRGIATFGAVTSASAAQMQRASATAKALGADLELPTATAGGAAEAMVELAKAGFRTDQAISATRASLVLSAAANVNAADSAKYLGDMMDQFAMGADKAGRAADILAATANSASGDIIDIYYAMKYAGPVAHGLGVSMEEAAAAVGMLGKAGILGQTAGTTLRGIFTNLAKPTKQMTEGLTEMGISAWDAEGRFKGLRYVIEKLSAAQHEMSQQDFTAAAAKAFGKPALSGAIALAHQGVVSFDSLNQAVHENGAAAQIAEAKNKGLSGAMVLLKKQTRQTGLEIYEGLAPGLEWLTRGLTTGMANATPYITRAIAYARDLSTVFGPALRAKASDGLGGLVDEAKALLGPLKALGETALADGLHILINAGEALMKVLSNLGDGLEPIGKSLADLGSDSDGAANALDIVVMVMNGASSAVGTLSGVLVPIGRLIGGLVSAFGALPGPVQTALFAMLLFRRVGPIMSGVASTVSGRVTGAFSSLNSQMAVQRTLASSAGVSLTRYGAAMAVLQTRVGFIGSMADSFRTASAASSGFAGSLRGVAAAAGTGLRSSMMGLMGVMGGPWGVALAGITVGLGMLAAHQQKAAAAAAAHKERISNLTQALRESNGAITESVRTQAAQTLQNTQLGHGAGRLVDVMGKLGYSLGDVTDSYLGQGQSIDVLIKQLDDLTEKEKSNFSAARRGSQEQKDTLDRAGAYKLAANALRDMSGDAATATRNARELNSVNQAAKGSSTAYDKLKTAVGALADKTADADQRTRALKDALDLLGGGSVSVQAAQARLNEALINGREAVDEQIAKSGDYGKSLLGLNGSIATTTKNGQQLFNSLNSIGDASASAAIAAYDFAQKSNKSLPESLAAARTEMEKARKGALDLMGQYGITGAQAEAVADSMGLIPGRVSILLQTKGMDEALAELLAVQAEFARMPNEKTIKVDALGEKAQEELKKLGYAIELIPGTREYKITAPTEGARAQLDALVTRMSEVPNKNVSVNALTTEGVANLQDLQNRISTTQGRTVTMTALTADARQALTDLGFQITNTNGKTVSITIPTGPPSGAVSTIQGAINSVHGKTVSITTIHNDIWRASGTRGPGPWADGYAFEADGGIRTFAKGGIRTFASGGFNKENHVAQIAKAGEWRVWAEDETGGESYIPLSPAKRPRSRRIAEETVRRLGGDPAGISWYANGGGLSNFSYTPSSLSTLSSIAGDSNDKDGKFSLDTFVSKLRSSTKTMNQWRSDLATVAQRAGSDVAKALQEMGDDGIELTRKMANGSAKYIKEMAGDLRALAEASKANLGEYSRQLGGAVTDQKAFQSNLAKLAASGFTDLAARLAEQGDQAAAELADQAVRNPWGAKEANAAAKAASNALSDEDLTTLVKIIGATRSDITGIHAIAETTGLDEDDIIAVANKAAGQISSALGSRGARLLADLARANKGLSYADGGIREGIYATSRGAVTFAEPSTGGEAYVPLGLSKRRRATSVLGDVADRFGYSLTGIQDANSGRVQVIVIQQAPLIGNQTIQIDRPGATEQQIAAAVGYQLRRAKRGGVQRR
ncbi:phage tail tape measure protein [Streptomyces sp. NPDC012765]|uniref:phage tail tape measure protein n=1 Tax=Streptomyces sp. NPDC012765 TaxID=3155249 RepID=UPI0033FB30C5